MTDLHFMAAEARQAALVLAATSIEQRNRALQAMAECLQERKEAIFAANQADIQQATQEKLSAPLLGRLKFGEEKLAQVIAGLHALADLPDPIGTTDLAR